VIVPQPAAQEIARTSGKVKLFTYMAVREDAMTLYGFLRQNEREMFTILIGVSGIGPQTAMNILSQIPSDEFILAILSEDEKTLTKISGVGTKSAKRLILELRDKAKKVSASMTPVPGSANQHVRDAVSALVSLGFTEKAAAEAVASAAGGAHDASIQVLIKAALAKLRER
jgi:Holliday junction DNA helicase RuvA